MTTMNQLPSYYERGTGATTVFVLHGAYGDGRYFADLADFLAASGYRVIVWDCPGYGSSAPITPATIENFAASAMALVRAKGSAHNVVLGHSMGALIAPYAANHEPRIDGVILSAGSSGFAARSPEDQERYIAERIAPIEQGVSVRDYALPLLRHMMADGSVGPLVDQVIDVVLAMKTETFATSIRAITLYDGRPALNQLSKPALLIAGREDPACTAAGMEAMHAVVGGSTFHVVEQAGHYAFAERPDTYKSIVRDWLHQHFPVQNG